MKPSVFYRDLTRNALFILLVTCSHFAHCDTRTEKMHWLVVLGLIAAVVAVALFLCTR